MASNEFLTWSNWLAGANENGHTRNPVVCMGKISGIKVRTQAKYGIVNVGLVATETVWTTSNDAGEEMFGPIGPDTQVVEIWTYNQPGYGVVDIGYKTANGIEMRITNNNDGKPSERVPLTGLRGLMGYEEGGYGITDIRFAGPV
jgi:hypothetical protein